MLDRLTCLSQTFSLTVMTPAKLQYRPLAQPTRLCTGAPAGSGAVRLKPATVAPRGPCGLRVARTALSHRPSGPEPASQQCEGGLSKCRHY